MIARLAAYQAQLLHLHRPVKHHIQRRTLPQTHLPAARRQNGRRSHARAFPRLDGQASNSRPAPGQNRDSPGVLSLPRAPAPRCSPPHHLLTASPRIHRTQMRRKLVHLAARGCAVRLLKEFSIRSSARRDFRRRNQPR